MTRSADSVRRWVLAVAVGALLATVLPVAAAPPAHGVVAAGSIVINEIMQNPSAVSDGDGEWFEVYNPTAAPIDIEGWTIADNDFDSHVISNGGPLLVPAMGYLVLGNNANTGTNGGAPVDYSYGGSWFLSNSADEVVLFDGTLAEVDRVEYDGGPSFPDPNGASMALIDPLLDNNAAASWCTSQTPFGVGDQGTPGAANDCTGPALVINEIDYDQPSTDTAEFVEIRNNSAAAVDLSAYTLVFVNGSNDTVYDTIALPATSLAAGDYFVVCANAATVANCDLDDGPDTNFIQNGAPDAVALLIGSTVVDTVSYEGDTGAPYTEGSGTGLEDNSGFADMSISRCPDGADTDQNSVDLIFTGITPGAANDCAAPPADPVINEFVNNHTGSDTNAFVELLGAPSTDYSALTVLEVEGDSTGAGTIDAALPVGSTDAAGYWTDPEDAENGTLTWLLVEGFTGLVGDDLDTNDDGVLDTMPWTRIVDDVAVSDGGPTDQTYSSTVLGPFFDGEPFGAGGASRIPNGTDTDAVGDWLRNDFDGFGFPGFPGSPAIGEAENTPGAVNAAITVDTDPLGSCGDPATMIFDIQGSGLSSPMVGDVREVEGIVVGDFEGTLSTQLSGFFLQEEDAQTDGDAATSDGIFVFNNGAGPGVAVGDQVRVRGTVAEFFDLTELNNVASVTLCSAGNPLPAAASPLLPVTSLTDWEAFEGMRIAFTQTLYASGNFNQGRFGEVDLSIGGPLDNPTNVVAPGAPALALQDLNDRSRIQLDDGSTVQNPLPLPPYLGPDNTRRTGDSVSGLEGVLSYSFGSYEVHPTGPVTFVRENDRPAGPPNVFSHLEVAAFNVLNYFTTLDGSGPICGPTGGQDCRGADNAFEFTRQRDKIVAAIVELDSDIVGLMEIENAPTDAPTADLVAGLNAAAGAGTYDFVATGPIGTDAIKVALLYQPATVAPVGPFAILDSSVDARFNDDKNRPALAQSFEDLGTGERFTVVVNHFKSKGSPCDDVGDPDAGDGQGNCNGVRTDAALAMIDWLATDPTGSGDPDFLITGDLNAYAMEDPITTLEGGGYADLIESFAGTGWADGAYSFNFFSQSGYLDHAMASSSLLSQVTGAGFWHTNADEPRGLDYNDFNQPLLYQPDAFRSSDHDAVVVGLFLGTARGAKQQTALNLAALLPTGSPKTDRDLSRALDRVNVSLTPAWWTSDDTLDLRLGGRVFDTERNAVKQLVRVVRGGSPFADDAVRIIDVLVSTDRRLAQLALDAAILRGGNPTKIAIAMAEMAGAEADLAIGGYEDAMRHFKKAWQQATKA